MLAITQQPGLPGVTSTGASNVAVVSIELALLALALLLLAAAALPPVIMPSRSMAILFQRRRGTMAVYGFAVLAIAGLTYAMSVLAA